MREIKFRGKTSDKTLKSFWEYGGIIHITERYKDEEDFEECDIWQLINTDGIAFDIDKDTIGQYTGLKDKNGVEIYEGDIVKVYCQGEYVVGKVIYEHCGFTVDVMNNKELEYGRVNILETFVEVIGNIYDNPELIEKGR